MRWLTEPVFVFTSDIDWASEGVISACHNLLSADRLGVTYFNTHKSPFLDEKKKQGLIDLLIHPNFLSGSSHGNSYDEVIEFCTGLHPNARGFRSHRYYEVNDITDKFASLGFKFFSNICTDCEDGIRPLRHRSGMISFPIFFEDGGYLQLHKNLIFEDLKKSLITPGLKIINFHPAHIAINTPKFSYMRNLKDSLSREDWNNLSENSISKLEFDGYGLRSMLLDIINFVELKNFHISTLEDLYVEYCQ